jgi:hypothetical protein
MSIRIQGNVIVDNSRQATFTRQGIGTGVSGSYNLISQRSQSGAYNALLYNTNSAGHGAYIRTAANRSDRYGLRVRTGANSWTLAVRSDGRVGINTSGPTEALHVNGRIRLDTQASNTTHAVRADRTLSAGDGLSGGGNLTSNRSFAVDGTVVRTSGNQTIGGTKTFTSSVEVVDSRSNHYFARFCGTQNNNSPHRCYVLLCRIGSGASNHIVGRIYGRRVSGAYNWGFADIAVNQTSSGVPYAMISQASGFAARIFRVVRCTFGGNGWIACEIQNSNNRVFSNGIWFTGQVSTSDTSAQFSVINFDSGQISNVSNIESTPSSTEFRMSSRLTIDGNISWSGTLTGGTVPWARLSGHPTITINSGSGLSGGASQNLAANRTWNLSVDGTVVRTSGNQTISGNKQFSGFTGFGVAPSTSYRIYSLSSGNASYLRTTSSSASVYGLRVRTGADSVTVGVMGNGRVGIGTSSPSQKLDVIGRIYSNDRVQAPRVDGTSQMRSPIYYDRGNTSYLVRPANTGGTGTRLRGVRVDHIGVGASGSGTTGRADFTSQIRTPDFYDRGNTTYRVRPANTGNSQTRVRRVRMDMLGVGTGNPTTTGQIQATNNIIAYSSDRRLKKDFEKIDSPLEKVGKLNGFHFRWDAAECLKWGFEPEEKDTGLIAQEVQSVLPDAVKPAPFDVNSRGKSRSGKNYLTVQYEKIIPLLVEAIKELKYENKDLKDRIDNLENPQWT